MNDIDISAPYPAYNTYALDRIERLVAQEKQEIRQEAFGKVNPSEEAAPDRDWETQPF